MTLIRERGKPVKVNVYVEVAGEGKKRHIFDPWEEAITFVTLHQKSCPHRTKYTIVDSMLDG